MSTELDNRYDALAWGSHLTPLLSCVCATEGPVLELGIGHFSTPILHGVCEAMNRQLVSVEDSAEWHVAFTKYNTPLHDVILSGYDTEAPFLMQDWGTVFIDNSPGGERRKKDFSRFLPMAQFVVVHDYERENEEAIAPLLGGVTWVVYTEYRPPTLVASIKRKLPSFT